MSIAYNRPDLNEEFIPAYVFGTQIASFELPEIEAWGIHVHEGNLVPGFWKCSNPFHTIIYTTHFCLFGFKSIYDFISSSALGVVSLSLIPGMNQE